MRAAILATVLLSAGCLTGPAPADGPPVTFDALTIETGLGTFTAIAFCDETPATCVFIRGLIDAGYYDGRAFGRVIPGFIIQEVDRTGGTTDQTETVAAEFGTRVMFSAGAFGIARDADPESGGSEFFVMDFAASHLYESYTAFAQVVEGMDVVHAIARVPTIKTGPVSSVAYSPPGSPVYFGVHDRVPIEPVTMTSVRWTTYELDAAEGARYPLVVAESTITDTYRATLESPRDLRVAASSALTWYVSARDSTPAGSVSDPEPLDLSDVEIRVTGPSTTTVTPVEAATRGVLDWAWTPAASGVHEVILLRQGEELARASVIVA